jgi:hypothetical protein
MSGNLKIFISLPYMKTQDTMGLRERWLLNWIGRAQLKSAQLHIWGKNARLTGGMKQLGK